MAKRRRDPDSDATSAQAASGYKTVFVATSLDTHLAISLSFSDTLADFKRKIMIQHEQCFPGFGALRIHFVKVKYCGKFYHLHESNMLVSSAFEGYDGRWSLFIDASSSLEDAKEKPSVDLSDDNRKLDSQSAPKAICAITWKSPGESSLNTGVVCAHVHGTCQEDFSSLVNHKLEENSCGSKDELKRKSENFQSDNSDESRAKVGLTAKRQKLIHSVHVAGDSASDIGKVGASHRFSEKIVCNLESFVGKTVSDDVQGRNKDTRSSYETSYSGVRVLPESGNLNASQAEPAAEESHALENEVVHRDYSDLSIVRQVCNINNVTPDKSVMDGIESMVCLNIPSRQLHVTPAAISESPKKRKNRKKQEHGTNPYVTDDQAATSKPGTVLEESVLPEVCGSETLAVSNHGKTDDVESMMTLTGVGRNDYKEKEGRFSSEQEVRLVEGGKPSHHGETTIPNEESVLSLGIAGVNKSAEADDSGGGKSKPQRRRAKKSDVPKQDQLDIDHDLGAAPKAHVEDEKKDESVLRQKDPDKGELNSELAVNHPPVVISSEGNKHLYTSEANLVREESPSASALNVKDDLSAGKSGCVRKIKKRKKSAAVGRSALKGSHSQNVAAADVADQSILSTSEGKEASKLVFATDPQKKGNMASDNDEVSLPLTEVGQTHSRNDVLDLYSGKGSYNIESPARASVQDQINTEQSKEAQHLPMDQANGKVENIETTKKRKKKTAKRTAASTGGGLNISEINQQNIGDQELASSVEKLGHADYADTLKVRGSAEKGIVDQSGVSGVGPKNSVDLKCTGKLEVLQQNADSPKVTPYEIENTSEIRRATVVSVANNTIASDGENGSVNFRKYFVPNEDHKEAESTDLPDKASNLVEVVKEVQEQKVLTKGKRKTSKPLENQKNSDGRKADDKKHANSVSKEKQNKKRIEKEILTKSGKLSKVPNHSDAKVNTSSKSVEPAVHNGSDSNANVILELQKTDESFASPNLNSSTKGSGKVLLSKSNRKKQAGFNCSTAAEGKVFTRKSGDPDNSSQERRFLSTPGVIFDNSRGDSSGDESGIGKSGSTTRTPSDNSSPSGDSTSEGSYDSERKNGGWKSTGSKLFDARDIPLDTIFRSSSRYKKAKLAASQSEAADTDSPQVDFVPDSQPIH